MSRNQTGEYEAGGRRSATEAQIVEQRATVRENRRGLGVEDLYEEAFRVINQMIIKYWRTPRVIDVLGQDGAQQWLKFVGPQLAGEYSYSCAMSQTPPETLEARRQQAMAVYQSMIADPAVDQVELRRFLSNAFNDVGFSRIFKPGVLEGDPRAGLQLQMQGVSGGGGGGEAGGGSPEGGEMSQM